MLVGWMVWIAWPLCSAGSGIWTCRMQFVKHCYNMESLWVNLYVILNRCKQIASFFFSLYALGCALCKSDTSSKRSYHWVMWFSVFQLCCHAFKGLSGTVFCQACPITRNVGATSRKRNVPKSEKLWERLNVAEKQTTGKCRTEFAAMLFNGFQLNTQMADEIAENWTSRAWSS